jgi:hypothetical protein
MAYQPNYYFIDEYQIPSMPSILIYDTHLDIEVDYGGDWYINAISMRDSDERIVQFKKGDWLFDLLTRNIYADHGMMELISAECKV